MNILGRVQNWLRRMLFPREVVQRDFNVTNALSATMEQNVALWYSMYMNRPPWADDKVVPLGLPSAIARELACPTMAEFNATISGGSYATFLNDCFQECIPNIERGLELGLSLGGVAIRPFRYGDTLKLDVTTMTGFEPTWFDAAGRCTAGVFKERTKVGRNYYVRLESHKMTVEPDGSTLYTIENKAYNSDSSGAVLNQIQLVDVPEWANIEPLTTIRNLEKPLFVFLSPIQANSVEIDSPVGMSVYGGPVAELVRQADEQWERIWWEFQSGERKVFTQAFGQSAEQFKKDRLFSVVSVLSDGGGAFTVFSPEYRNAPLYDGFQAILKQIEFQTGLSYGTISDPQSVDKTATEVQASKQRQYITVNQIQKKLGNALEDLVYAFDAYAQLYQMRPYGPYEVNFQFGDGVLDDPESNRQDMAIDLQLVSAGIMNDWEYRMKYFREDEDTAKAALPKMADLSENYQDEVE